MKLKFAIIFTIVSMPIIAMEKPLPKQMHPQNIQEKVQAIVQKYNLNPNRCRIAINREVVITGYEPNLEIACLVAGFKDVYLMSNEDELQSMDPHLKALLTPLHIDHIKLDKEHAIIYTPRGQRNALLLAEIELKKLINIYSTEKTAQGYRIIAVEQMAKDTESSTYLIGLLLGYKEEDIEFFHIFGSFSQWYSKLLNEPITERLDSGTYPNWPQKDKDAFTQFEKNVWPSTPDYKDFQEDKKAAVEWIQKHKHFSNDELKKQIDESQRQLNILMNPKKTREFEWIRWWKN